MPVDTVKTVLQVHGEAGMEQLQARIAVVGLGCMYDGALAAALATLVGHFPWFVTHNYLTSLFPDENHSSGAFTKLSRRAAIGFASSVVSDCVSNGVRVLKTVKQTSQVQVTYGDVLSNLLQTEGVWGLMGRGLGTKVLANGISAMLFTVMWKWLMQLWQQHYGENNGRGEGSLPTCQTPEDTEPLMKMR